MTIDEQATVMTANHSVILSYLRDTLLWRASILGADVDFSGLRYVTSPALGILINYYKKTQARGGDTKFFGLEDNILEIFKIVGLTRTFDIHAGEAGAVGAFAKK